MIPCPDFLSLSLSRKRQKSGQKKEIMHEIPESSVRKACFLLLLVNNQAAHKPKRKKCIINKLLTLKKNVSSTILLLTLSHSHCYTSLSHLLLLQPFTFTITSSSISPSTSNIFFFETEAKSNPPPVSFQTHLTFKLKA